MDRVLLMCRVLEAARFRRLSETGSAAPVPYPENGHVYQFGAHQVGLYPDARWNHSWDSDGIRVTHGRGSVSLRQDLQAVLK